MRLLYLDIVGGISGDMTVAALIELGVPLERLREALRQVGLQGVALATERGVRHSLAGTRFLVRDLHGAGAPGTDAPRAASAHGHHHEHAHAHGHHHEHAHDHPHGPGPGDAAGPQPGHAHGHGHPHAHGHPHRAYRDIRALLEGSALPPGARDKALAVFARLAEAEGAVHGIPAEEVTFHEVGAWDSIADVVCAAVGLEHLAPERIYCSPVPVGAGTVTTAHGRMPVPTPATLRLLQGFPIVQGGPAFERTTPTGAAILAALAAPAPEPLAYTPERVGIGIGTRDSPEVPNLLRAVLGRSGSGGPAETVECAEANLDDANPEWIGYAMERLLDAGALDVALIPVHMKKNRPGTLLQALYPPALRDTVLGVLFAEVTTLGVRYHTLQRAVLPRERVAVATPWGEVAGVVALHGGRRHFAPEHDACRAVAERAGVPLRDVYGAAQEGWRELERRGGRAEAPPGR